VLSAAVLVIVIGLVSYDRKGYRLRLRARQHAPNLSFEMILAMWDILKAKGLVANSDRPADLCYRRLIVDPLSQFYGPTQKLPILRMRP
jgi:hypothetical protein